MAQNAGVRVGPAVFPGAETLANLGIFQRVRGGMETGSQPLERKGVRPGNRPVVRQAVSHAVVEERLAQRLWRLGLGYIHQQWGHEVVVEATITSILCGERLADCGQCVHLSRLSFCPRNFLTPPKSGVVVLQHYNTKQLTALIGQWHGNCDWLLTAVKSSREHEHEPEQTENRIRGRGGFRVGSSAIEPTGLGGFLGALESTLPGTRSDLGGSGHQLRRAREGCQGERRRQSRSQPVVLRRGDSDPAPICRSKSPRQNSRHYQQGSDSREIAGDFSGKRANACRP